MAAYYNEIDPYAAQWLRNLIAGGHIAPGEVDQRSIEDVTPQDLKGFTQCHFFAGIGVWSYALRRAGWSDDRPVWTGSCPCQPFSACGKRKGKGDKRHLFPTWFRLISECQPNVIFGEQVASGDGLDWIDDVRNQVENANYAFAGFDLCAAGVGAPHIRQRLYWVADSNDNKYHEAISEGTGEASGAAAFDRAHIIESGKSERTSTNDACRMADTNGELMEAPIQRREGGRIEFTNSSNVSGLANSDNAGQCADCRSWSSEKQPEKRNNTGRGCKSCRLADSCCEGWEGRVFGRTGSGRQTIDGHPGCDGATYGTYPTNGLWRDADWLFCRDGKWRPVKPGLEPLVNGFAGRVGKLRAYGNAIVAPVAETFIAAYMGCAR
ncbi:DNA cytosine methyltransferase [Buttiauxella sp. 3AFRM03]|uniref:DNA cytosine methyltransferase n=1 Tax=Buttiauxella sp. 3AFRM03 TaxID=2479367 RepID=UPI000EF81B3B|nr:DNA cytosine methyltransferase [Buttiauxella sp. 3AFRM03]AYN26557.1 DNA cytosine methyltransferase [Buttiauxella sp. 3AFRM03]